MKEFKVKEIHHISFLVSDLKRSIDFYCRILDLEIDFSRPDLGYDGVWLKLDRTQIHLLALPNPDAAVSRPDHVGRDRHGAFFVEGLKLIESVLEQNNISFTKSRSGRKALFCRDPDGNGLEFIESE